MNRLPESFRQELPTQDTRVKLAFLKEHKINTVCVSAHCPNLNNCFKEGHLTFMLLGNICTRSCLFCAVDKNQQPLPVDDKELYQIADAAKILGFKYIVITSVTRDDLPDKGAGYFAKIVEILKSIISGIKIELLIPDFQGDKEALKEVVQSQPNVIAHNMETIPRLYKQIRPQSDYRFSLNILRNIKELNCNIRTKSSLMLGLGEQEPEVIETLRDLRRVNCDMLTLGQYLRPSALNYSVAEFISQEQFNYYRNIALDLGFMAVASGPLVRSSYKAEELYNEISKYV